MNRKRVIHVLKPLAKGAVTALLALLVLRRVDISELASMVRQSDPVFLLLAVLIYFASFLASTVRSGLFLRDADVVLGFGQGLRLYLLGVVGNLALPGGIGGDGYKLLRLRKSHDASAKRILKAFLLERVSGLWAIGAWLTALSWFIPGLPFRGLPALAGFLALSAAYAFVVRRLFPEHAGGWLRKHTLSLGIQGLVSLSVLCILSAQTRDFTPSSYLFGFHASTVLSILNIGLSGLGVREFVMGFTAEALGNDPVLSVFTASAFWVVSTVAALPGLWVFWREGMPPDRKVPEDDAAKEDLISS
jgi:uncharacterized membrane protein YbhN (UPF0104 family)